jgi:hypothetical protein
MRLGGGRGEDGRKRCVGYFRRWLRASLAGIIKITTEKIQISILAIHFFIHTPTDSLFYSLFSLNIILCRK